VCVLVCFHQAKTETAKVTDSAENPYRRAP